VQPGGSVIIRGDNSGNGRVYSEEIDFVNSGILGQEIIVKGLSGEKVVIEHSGKINFDQDYYLIENLVFDHLNQAGRAIVWRGDGTTLRGSEVKNGACDSGNCDGIHLKANDAVIENSLIHDFKKFVGGVREDTHCIITEEPTINLVIRGNEIYDCTGDGIQTFATTSSSPITVTRNIVIEDNHVYSTLGLDAENAFDFKEGSDMIVRNNIIHGYPGNKAVVFQKFHQNVLFEGNVIYDSVRGVEFRREGNDDQVNIDVLRNVIYDIDDYGLKFDGVVDVDVYHNTIVGIGSNGITIEGSFNGGNIKNNLFADATKTKLATANFVAEVEYNGWFNTNAKDLAGVGDTIGVDARFVDVLNNDYHLLEDSEAIDAGIFEAGFNDGYRGLAPDLGVFEFDSGEPIVQCIIDLDCHDDFACTVNSCAGTRCVVEANNCACDVANVNGDTINIGGEIKENVDVVDLVEVILTNSEVNGDNRFDILDLVFVAARMRICDEV
jgi:hypothetical protein